MTVQEYARKHGLTVHQVYGAITKKKVSAVKDGWAWDISDTELAAATITTNGTGLKQKLAALETRLAELEHVVLGGE